MTIAPLALAIPEHIDSTIDEQSQHSTLPPSRRDSLISQSKRSSTTNLHDFSPTATLPSFKGSEQGPLVLLHITLLPLPAPWYSTQLSSTTEERLHLLQSRSTPEICARGVLVEHPGPDFGLLEDRILAALGLSDAIFEDTWDVQVFAASGLMTRASWAVAWEEMERVDVAVTPSVTVEEGLAMERSTPQRFLDLESLDTRVATLEEHARSLETVQARNVEKRRPQRPVRAEQVPLDILLRNYLHLLAKDIRNLAIVALLLCLFATGFKSKPGAARTDTCDVLAQTLVDTFSSIQAANTASIRSEPDNTHESFPVSTPYLTVMVNPGDQATSQALGIKAALDASSDIAETLPYIGTVALVEYDSSQSNL